MQNERLCVYRSATLKGTSNSSIVASKLRLMKLQRNVTECGIYKAIVSLPTTVLFSSAACSCVSKTSLVQNYTADSQR